MSNQTLQNDEINRGRKTKNSTEIALRSAWLGMRDSNPRSRDQNPVPYHLANPQYELLLYLSRAHTTSHQCNLRYASLSQRKGVGYGLPLDTLHHQ